MDQQKKTCTRCSGTKNICYFQTADGKSRSTCMQCRESMTANAKKRRSDSQLDLDFGELEKFELKQKIKNMLEDENNEFYENNSRGMQFKCVLKVEEFEDTLAMARSIAQYIEGCDGYSYKYAKIFFFFLILIHRILLTYFLFIVFTKNMYQPQAQMLLLFITTVPSQKSSVKSQKSLKKLRSNVTERL